MTTLAIDIETYSSADLLKSGVYKYVQAPDFEILLFGYQVDDQPAEVVDLINLEDLPADIMEALTDPKVLKTAYNAAFERTCISQHFGITLPPQQWECTAVKASMIGLPIGLDLVAKALKLEQEKDSTGKALIRYFSIPCKPSKANGGRTRNMPEHDPEKWNRFVEYCRQDVVVEQAIREKIAFFKIPDTERKLWWLDQKINDGGVLLDPAFVQNAIRLNAEYRQQMTEEAIKLTGLDNPNSVDQLKNWISDEIEDEVLTLRKQDIPGLLKKTDCDQVTRVLKIRQQLSKTSVKKYTAMMKALCSDNRVRGMLQFYGANRTGRWAGRIVQLHNLPKNSEELFGKKMSCLDMARDLVCQGDLEMLTILFDNVPDVLSQLIRTAFIAKPGHRLLIADFSAIEARILAWLAGETWRLDVFNSHGKIYEASASQMFKVPITDVTKGSDLRNKGKMSELALGYQGGPNAIIKIEISNGTPVEKRIPEEELPRLVKMWRNANKKIVAYWSVVQEAAIEAMQNPGAVVPVSHGISFQKRKNFLFLQLPSKRELVYYNPVLRPNKFSGLDLYYEGMDQQKKKWELQQTYGGKLVENIVQGVARDILADAMLRLDAAGYNIPVHVHDEVVAEEPIGKGSLEEVNKIMGEEIPWAKGLPLRAESYESYYYKKD